jgi:hypothetical protein
MRGSAPKPRIQVRAERQRVAGRGVVRADTIVIGDSTGNWRDGFTPVATVIELRTPTAPRTQTIKRECNTGRYLPRKLRANRCGTAGQGARRPVFERPAGERPAPAGTLCFRTRGALARAFRDENQNVIDAAGGLTMPHGARAFDAVNERYGLHGARRVDTLGKALLAVLPHGRPFCFEAIDLEPLNETMPGRDYGPFVLPDAVTEARLYAQYLAGAARGETE